MISLKPVLMIIDMQRGMREVPMSSRNNPNAEQNIAALLEAWRSKEATVIHVRHLSKDRNSPFWPGQSGVEFQPEFFPMQHEKVFDKQVTDAFTHSHLEHWLQSRSIRQLIIVGVSTNNSVESTTRAAGNLGFDASVVADATFTFPKYDYAGVLRSADEVHTMSLANLDGEFARIITTAQALELINQ